MRLLISSVVLVLILAFVSIPVLSQTNIGLLGVGAKLGYVDPEDIDATFGFGVVADLGTIKPDIALEAELGYWSTSKDIFGMEVTLRDISISATAKYLIKMEGNIQPYAGGGLGFHMFKSSCEFQNFYTGQKEKTDDSETKIGFHVCGGGTMVLSPQLTGLAELRYAIIDDASTLSLMAGVIYSLGK